MKIGHLTLSVARGVERDVDVRISSAELFSAISDPSGPIKGVDVVRYEVAEDRSSGAYRFHLFVCLAEGTRVLFYTGASPADLALLLDEFEASLPNVPRSRANA